MTFFTNHKCLISINKLYYVCREVLKQLQSGLIRPRGFHKYLEVSFPQLSIRSVYYIPSIEKTKIKKDRKNCEHVGLKEPCEKNKFKNEDYPM